MRYYVVLRYWGMLVVASMVFRACSPQPITSPLATMESFVSPLIPTNEVKQGPIFTIDKPVLAGATEVTGSGPAGVPIRLVDVTEVGLELATTTVDENGRFVFRLADGLPAGHSVGLQIGDLAGTSFKEEDFLYSDTYYDRPYIGVLFDIAPVTEP